MKFVLVTGPAITIECAVCQAHIVGGTDPYPSASTGDSVQPAEVYREEAGGMYCSNCARKLAVEDPTRSVNQFFSDTQGKEIEEEHL
jgi:hypothetical protein